MDEQNIIDALQVAFEGKIIHTQYFIQSKNFNAYLPKYKAGIEIENMIMKVEIVNINKVNN